MTARRTSPATAGEVEHEIHTAVKAGREADFTEDNERWKLFARPGETMPIVGADLVKELVLGAKAARGVQIKGARIEGLLDLKDARGPTSDACNALILTECVLVGKGTDSPVWCPGLDARHSHLQRLALVDCQVDGVDLTSAVITGELDLNGLGPLRLDDVDMPNGAGSCKDFRRRRACWVKARGIRVGGSLTARGAQLSLPWSAEWPPAGSCRDPTNREPRNEYWRSVNRPSGLDLQGAEIAGSLILKPDFTGQKFASRGGVNLSSATIGVMLDAADALMHEAVIGVPKAALLAEYMQVQASVLLEPCEIRTLNLSGAVIGGNLMIEAATTARSELIDATALRVGGNLKLSGPLGTANLSGSVIEGEVVLGKVDAGSVIEGEVVPGEVTVPLDLTRDGELTLAYARVGRDLNVVRVKTPTTFPTFPVKIDWNLQEGPLRIRTRRLASYPKWSLAEALLKPTCGSGLAILSFLHRTSDQRDKLDEVVFLDGRSEQIYNHNTFLVLETAEQAMEYLAFFCAHVWGEEGAFLVVPDSVRVSSRPGESWAASADVRYGSALFRADFEIRADGEVEMLDDELIEAIAEDKQRLYTPPVRWFDVPRAEVGAWPVPPPLGPAWSDDPVSVDRRLDFLKALQQQPTPLDLPPIDPRWQEPPRWQRPRIDLNGLKVASLIDGSGRSWFYGASLDGGKARPKPTLRLDLRGFEYDRISDRRVQPPLEHPTEPKGPLNKASSEPNDQATTSSPDTPSMGRAAVSGPESGPDLENRRGWLEAQYEGNTPTEREYSPQPYQQLARVWRAEGRFDDADQIAYIKLEHEKVKIRRPEPSRSQRWKTSAAVLESAALASFALWVVAWLGIWVPPDLIGFVTIVLVAAAIVVWVADSVRRKQRLWRWCVQWPFGFGLRPQNALVTLVVFWMVGVGATIALQSFDVLKVDASPVATVVSQGGGERVVVEEQDISAPREEVECKDHISAMVYPLDAMIPLVDLRQEFRCQLSIKGEVWPVFDWGLMKGVYSVVGWLVLIGFIVTASGVVRRRIEG